jgi:hypothetical protein
LGNRWAVVGEVEEGPSLTNPNLDHEGAGNVI